MKKYRLKFLLFVASLLSTLTLFYTKVQGANIYKETWVISTKDHNNIDPVIREYLGENIRIRKEKNINKTETYVLYYGDIVYKDNEFINSKSKNPDDEKNEDYTNNDSKLYIYEIKENDVKFLVSFEKFNDPDKNPILRFHYSIPQRSTVLNTFEVNYDDAKEEYELIVTSYNNRELVEYKKYSGDYIEELSKVVFEGEITWEAPSEREIHTVHFTADLNLNNRYSNEGLFIVRVVYDEEYYEVDLTTNVRLTLERVEKIESPVDKDDIFYKKAFEFNLNNMTFGEASNFFGKKDERDHKKQTIFERVFYSLKYNLLQLYRKDEQISQLVANLTPNEVYSWEDWIEYNDKENDHQWQLENQYFILDSFVYHEVVPTKNYEDNVNLGQKYFYPGTQGVKVPVEYYQVYREYQKVLQEYTPKEVIDYYKWTNDLYVKYMEYEIITEEAVYGEEYKYTLQEKVFDWVDLKPNETGYESEKWSTSTPTTSNGYRWMSTGESQLRWQQQNRIANYIDTGNRIISMSSPSRNGYRYTSIGTSTEYQYKKQTPEIKWIFTGKYTSSYTECVSIGGQVQGYSSYGYMCATTKSTTWKDLKPGDVDYEAPKWSNTEPAASPSYTRWVKTGSSRLAYIWKEERIEYEWVNSSNYSWSESKPSDTDDIRWISTGTRRYKYKKQKWSATDEWTSNDVDQVCFNLHYQYYSHGSSVYGSNCFYIDNAKKLGTHPNEYSGDIYYYDRELTQRVPSHKIFEFNGKIYPIKTSGNTGEYYFKDVTVRHNVASSNRHIWVKEPASNIVSSDSTHRYVKTSEARSYIKDYEPVFSTTTISYDLNIQNKVTYSADKTKRYKQIVGQPGEEIIRKYINNTTSLPGSFIREVGDYYRINSCDQFCNTPELTMYGSKAEFFIIRKLDEIVYKTVYEWVDIEVKDKVASETEIYEIEPEIFTVGTNTRRFVYRPLELKTRKLGEEAKFFTLSEWEEFSKTLGNSYSRWVNDEDSIRWEFYHPDTHSDIARWHPTGKSKVFNHYVLQTSYYDWENIKPGEPGYEPAQSSQLAPVSNDPNYRWVEEIHYKYKLQKLKDGLWRNREIDQYGNTETVFYSTYQGGIINVSDDVRYVFSRPSAGGYIYTVQIKTSDWVDVDPGEPDYQTPKIASTQPQTSIGYRWVQTSEKYNVYVKQHLVKKWKDLEVDQYGNKYRTYLDDDRDVVELDSTTRYKRISGSLKYNEYVYQRLEEVIEYRSVEELKQEKITLADWDENYRISIENYNKVQYVNDAFKGYYTYYEINSLRYRQGLDIDVNDLTDRFDIKTISHNFDNPVAISVKRISQPGLVLNKKEIEKLANELEVKNRESALLTYLDLVMKWDYYDYYYGRNLYKHQSKKEWWQRLLDFIKIETITALAPGLGNSPARGEYIVRDWKYNKNPSNQTIDITYGDYVNANIDYKLKYVVLAHEYTTDNLMTYAIKMDYNNFKGLVNAINKDHNIYVKQKALSYSGAYRDIVPGENDYESPLYLPYVDNYHRYLYESGGTYRWRVVEPKDNLKAHLKHLESELAHSVLVLDSYYSEFIDYIFEQLELINNSIGSPSVYLMHQKLFKPILYLDKIEGYQNIYKEIYEGKVTVPIEYSFISNYLNAIELVDYYHEIFGLIGTRLIDPDYVKEQLSKPDTYEGKHVRNFLQIIADEKTDGDIEALTPEIINEFLNEWGS